MIILNGNLSYFNLSGLLRFLYSNKLTGVLHVRRNDKTIDIHVLSGKTIGVEPASKDSIAQLIEISTWLKGDFSFELVSEENLTRNITVPHDQLTLLIAKKEKEFKEIKSSLPPMNAVLVMSPAGQSGEIRLQPNEWNLLSKVDGKRTMEEIVHMLELDDLSIFSMVVKMIQKGILKVAGGESPEEAEILEEGGEEGGPLLSSPTDIVPEPKMKGLEKIFMRYVGPMGTIILDEILESLRLNRAEIPQEMLPSLIEKMSEEIETEEDRRQFNEEAQKL